METRNHEKIAFYKNCYEAIEKQWKDDVKKWLNECKKQTKVTDQILADWDKKLNDASNINDIESFCEYTGWKFGKSPFDIDGFIENLPQVNPQVNYEDWVFKIIYK